MTKRKLARSVKGAKAGKKVPPKCDIGESMRAVLGLAWDLGSIDVDVRPECEDEWTKDYAIIELDVIEPEDPRFLDLDAVWDSIKEQVEQHFPGGEWVERADKSKASVKLRLHTKHGWNAEIEAHR